MTQIMLIISILSIFGKDINHNYLDEQLNISITNFIEEYKEYQEYQSNNYYEGESVEEIATKLNKYLKGTLKNKGEFITRYSIEVGIDPYLAGAVMLHESGCYWGCSYLTRVCYNVAGNKGKPACNGGSYKKFDSIEDGMKFSMDVLASYYKKGKTTAEEINPKYAADKTWYKKVNRYIKKLKNA